MSMIYLIGILAVLFIGGTGLLWTTRDSWNNIDLKIEISRVFSFRLRATSNDE